MREVSPASPTVGLTAIARADMARVRSEDGHQTATFTGRTIRQNVRALYDQRTLKDAAFEMTVPQLADQELLQPRHFEAALLTAFDKLEAHLAEGPEGARAHATLRTIKDAMEQCRYNIAALNQV